MLPLLAHVMALQGLSQPVQFGRESTDPPRRDSDREPGSNTLRGAIASRAIFHVAHHDDA